MFSAELAFADSRRRSPREAVTIDTILDGDGLSKCLCRVIDLSPEGVRLSTYSLLPAFGAIVLTLPGIGARLARIIWAEEFLAGCAFDEPLSPAMIRMLKVRFPGTATPEE